MVTFPMKAASCSHLGLLPPPNGLPVPTLPQAPHNPMPHIAASMAHGDCDHGLMILTRSGHVPVALLPLDLEQTPESITGRPP